MLRTLGLSTLLALALVGEAREARAKIPETTPTIDTQTETEPEPPKRWYGWQTALADVGTASIAILALSDDRYRNLLYVAAAGYLAAPAGIHLAYRNVKSAQWSGIMRLGVGTLAITTGFIISARTGAANDEGPKAPTYITVATALSVPVVIDAAFLSWASIEESTMVVGARDGGFDLRLGGRF